MENICLEGVWKERLSGKNWPKLAINKFIMSLSPTTWLTYNRQFNKFREFVENRGINLEDLGKGIPQNLMVDYLMYMANKSERPKAVLNCSVEAVQNYVKVTGAVSPVDSDVITLVNGLVKSCTTQPLKRSKVLPVQPFLDLFRKWGKNADLSIWALRLKALMLLAITVMLRPSDVAPHSVNASDEVVRKNQFRRSWLDFSDSKYLRMYLFGIKNDYQHDGFCVFIPYASEQVVCPVLALQTYLDKTKHLVKPDGPVFLTLQ